MDRPEPLVAILTALKEEMQAIRPRLRGTRSVRTEGLKYARGSLAGWEVVAAQTGIGADRAGALGSRLMELEHPRLVIMTGFAGALREGLEAGDIFVASQVLELEPSPEVSRSSPQPRSWDLPAQLVEVASGAQVPGGGDSKKARVISGKLVSVRKVLRGPNAKRELGESAQADAVDMESSAVVEEGERRGCPVLCIRAILDDVECELPFDFGKILTPLGRPRPVQLLGEVARNPGKIARLLELRSKAQIAQKSLGAFLPNLLEALSRVNYPESAP